MANLKKKGRGLTRPHGLANKVKSLSLNVTNILSNFEDIWHVGEDIWTKIVDAI